MGAKDLVLDALRAAVADLGLQWQDNIVVEAPREAGHGDLATNAALALARQAGRPPRELAADLAARLGEAPGIAAVEVAGPGFCNMGLASSFWQGLVLEALEKGADFGKGHAGRGRRAQVEYVSANPTGPLHVGHARGAAYGDSLARLLANAGFEVQTEYYVNDAGRQMSLLGLSIWLAAKELAGHRVEWPEDYYRGDYIRELARQFLEEKPDLAGLPDERGRAWCQERGTREILAGIRRDLAGFNVAEQNFFSEKSLVQSGAVQKSLDRLAELGQSYEKDGALWLASQALGDDKDRVLRKSDGSLTYFGSDIAYHHDKFNRGFDWIIDVWGADHHGYVARMNAAMQALGHDPRALSVSLIQLVNLRRGDETVGMSTRAGAFVTLEELVREVGADAARFIFLSRKSDSPLDFDMELAKSRSMDNPVYYVQYAHARVSAVKRRAAALGLGGDPMEADLALLDTPEDLALMRQLGRFGEVAEQAALGLAPHHVGRYAHELAGLLHGYYARRQVLDPDNPALSGARLALLAAVGQTLANALGLLGVSAPDAM